MSFSYSCSQVQRIHSIMGNKCVKPNSETFRRSISLCIRIKDVISFLTLSSSVAIPRELYFINARKLSMNVMFLTDTMFTEPLGFVQFEGAYNMLGNLKNFNLAPNSSMYNSIMAGYFREVTISYVLFSIILLSPRLVQHTKKHVLYIISTVVIMYSC